MKARRSVRPRFAGKRRLFRRSLGLRGRLVAAFTAVALLATALTAGIAYLLERRAVLRHTQGAVLDDVRNTLTQAIPAQLPDPRENEEVLRFVGNSLVRPGRTVWVVGPTTSIEVSGGDFPWRATQRMLERMRRMYEPKAPYLHQRMLFQRVIYRGTPYLVVGTPLYTATAKEPAPSGITVFVVVSLGPEADEISELASSVGLAGGAAIVLALILALLAARTVLLPVRRLGVAARGLGAGRLETRAEIRGGDELADLARTFNETAETLQRNVFELRALEAAARRFAADVSHELRTPLTAITAVTDVLEEETAALPGPAAEAAGLISEETRRLRTLVEHLIEISRFDAGAATLVLDDRDVGELVADVLRMRGWTGEVTADLPAGVRAPLDPRRVDAIVANLVGNALEHGAPPVFVRLRADRSGWAIRVGDHGPGIPEELRSRVFDRFVKADAARQRSDGTGLGLAIARANAELHGGTLSLLEDTTETIFELWLPFGREESTCDT